MHFHVLSRFAAFSVMAAAALIGHAQLTNQAEPLPGITTSGQPDETALADLADGGFVAVIDLRTPDEERGLEEQSIVESLGMKYFSLPIDGPGAVNYENAEALNAILGEARGPVLIHCSTGNRAGALLSLRQRLNGAGVDEALETGIRAGMTSPVLRHAVEAQLIARPEPSAVAPR